MGGSLLKSDWRQWPYLFHLHTSYTDGDLTAAQCVHYAAGAGVSTVVFLEHIRRKPDYDVDRFSAEVELAGRGSVRTVLGFEAKLLPDGSLDISSDILGVAAVIGIAEHGFPNDAGLLRDSFLKVVGTYPLRWPRTTFVWVHPGLWYRKHQLDSDENADFLRMFTKASEAGVLIEQNLRYGLVTPAIAAKLPISSLVTGADAHSLSDLRCWATHVVGITSPQLRERAPEPAF